MTATPLGGERRIRALDSLRGVAILLVIASHYLPARLPQSPLTPHLLAIGRGGVILFFLLSGYLIFRNVERQPAGVFVMRRLFKILPSYWLNLACLLALDASFAGAAHHPGMTYLTDFAMVSDVTHRISVSGVYWTLLIEVKFYLLIAVQYAVLKDRFLPGVVAGLLGLGLVVLAWRGHGSQLLAFFPVFYVGIFIYRAEQAGWRLRPVLALALTTAAVAAGIAVEAGDLALWSAGYMVAATVLFVFCLRLRLGCGWLGFLGTTSYSNYLYHAMIGEFVFALIGPTASASGTLAAICIAFVAAVAAAVLLYRAVELPLVRLGRRCEALIWRGPRVAFAAAAGGPAAP